jgi:G3E family GTPase
MMSPEERIAVSVITGFLGSGKTTLLNNILRDPAMGDAAVIVNEFGAIGIDNHLIRSSNESTILLGSGCVCCVVRGDLVDTMRDLLVQRSRGDVPPFRRLLIETTGLADPAPLLHTLMSMPVAARYRLDSVVTTVDAVVGSRTLEQHSEAVKQAAVADRLFITKVDLADRAAIEDIDQRLSRLNPAASRRGVVQGAVTPDEIFGETVYDPAKRIVDVARWLQAEEVAAAEGAPAATAGRHEARISSFSLSFLQPFHWREVAAWLDALAKARGEDLLRVKGIVNIVDAEGPVVVHAVQHLFHPPLMLERWPTPLKRSQLVFITRDLSREYVLEVLAAVRNSHATPAPASEPFHPASA